MLVEHAAEQYVCRFTLAPTSPSLSAPWQARHGLHAQLHQTCVLCQRMLAACVADANKLNTVSFSLAAFMTLPQYACSIACYTQYALMLCRFDQWRAFCIAMLLLHHFNTTASGKQY